MISALTLWLALAQSPSSSVWEDPRFELTTPWRSLDTGKIKLDARPVTPGAYSEYRAITDSTPSVEAFCVAVFEWGTHGTDNPGTKLSRLLRDGDDERVVYTQLEQPVVSNRDYALTVSRRRERTEAGQTQRCSIRFIVTNEFAPPKTEGMVRMERLWGSWTFERGEGGLTRITYTLFADPAGSIPPFLVHGAQRSAAKESLEMAITKAKALSP